jgi:hypothetical protein
MYNSEYYVKQYFKDELPAMQEARQRINNTLITDSNAMRLYAECKIIEECERSGVSKLKQRNKEV